jgi:hypothetical protein
VGTAGDLTAVGRGGPVAAPFFIYQILNGVRGWDWRDALESLTNTKQGTNQDRGRTVAHGRDLVDGPGGCGSLTSRGSKYAISFTGRMQRSLLIPRLNRDLAGNPQGLKAILAYASRSLV